LKPALNWPTVPTHSSIDPAPRYSGILDWKNTWHKGMSMKNFFAWFQDNSTQIAWFLIGFFIYGAIDNFARGNWTGAGINLLFAGMNYFINRK
jgi:hypothetical protein